MEVKCDWDFREEEDTSEHEMGKDLPLISTQTGFPMGFNLLHAHRRKVEKVSRSYLAEKTVQHLGNCSPRDSRPPWPGPMNS